MLLCFLATLLHGAHARADAFDLGDATWEGCSELVSIAKAELGASRVEVRGTLDWSKLSADDGVLLLHPTRAVDSEEATAFMKAGGRLALLDDYGKSDELLRRFQIERISLPTRPVSALRNNPSLAIAEPAYEASAGANAGPHPVVANVPRLVLNHGVGFRHPALSPVLRVRGVGEPDVIVAVAGQVGKGRLFAMGDPSAIMNQMLRYQGNRAFAAALVRYLVDDASTGRKGGRLWVMANKLDQDGSFGGKSTLAKELEGQLDDLLERLEEWRKEGFPPWLQLILAAALALGVATWVARASARPYQAPVPRHVRPVPLVGQGGVAGRFAVLAAPSSPRALVLLELKSALFEAVTLRFGLEREPSPASLEELVGREVDEATKRDLHQTIATMQSVESSVLRGRPARVEAGQVERASDVVHAVLERIAPELVLARRRRSEPEDQA